MESSQLFYRYPGVQPFSIEEKDIFFGREDDTNNLFDLLMLEKVVVIFGKSGYGKSSIINAGVIPKVLESSNLRRFAYVPIKIRIGKIAGDFKTPLEKILVKLEEYFQNIESYSFFKKHEGLPKLWSKFKELQLKNVFKILLIFDQFEDFFAYSHDDQVQFNWEIANLLYTDVPQLLRENIENIDASEYDFISTKIDVKILFSIRSDRLSLLHSMKEFLPGILNYRFEVKPLTHIQAIDAIKLPASKKEDKFVTHPFSYDDTSLEKILFQLSIKRGDGAGCVEGFHLQMICQACEVKILDKLKKGEIDTEINIEDLPEFDNLYEEYYLRQLATIPVEFRETARTILEDGLIFEDDTSKQCYRVSVDGNVLRNQFRNFENQDIIFNYLVNTLLVRREDNSVGGYSYEVSHDTILDPILKNKRRRKEELQAELNRQEIKMQALREFSQRRKKRALVMGITCLMLGVLLWYYKEISFAYTALTDTSPKPALSRKYGLTPIIEKLEFQLRNDTKKFEIDPKLGAWEASQMLSALQGVIDSGVISTFARLSRDRLSDSSCCCWVEMKGLQDMRPTGWIVSSIGTFGLSNKYECNVLGFFIENQLTDGSWSMFKIDKHLVQYGSTYTTCHVIRALHNSLRSIDDTAFKIKVVLAINNGINWLLKNMGDSRKSIWSDYPKNSDQEDIASVSLSGLAIHTLNLVKNDSIQKQLNRKWLTNLKTSDAYIAIDKYEQSLMLYKINSSEAEITDPTRHLVLPWQIIATVDAFKDGNFIEKYKAIQWLDIVANNLNLDEIQEKSRFIRAEILISLRYLMESQFVFN